MNKTIHFILLSIFLFFSVCTQVDEKHLEHKVNALLTARHNWDQAADSLAAFGERAVKPVLAILTDPGQSDWNKRKAAWTLGKIKSPKPASEMMKLLNAPKTRYPVRLALVEALGQIQSKKAIPSLLEQIQTKDIRMRNAALNALNSIGATQTRDLSMNALNDPNPYIRSNALSVLSEQDQGKGFPLYIKALYDESMIVQQQAQDILIKWGDTLLDSILSKMSSPEVHLRRKLTTVLTNIDNNKTIPLLLRCLKDKDWMVQNRAMVTLSKKDISAYTKTIKHLLNSSSPDTRNNAAWLLGETGQVYMQTELIKALEMPESGWSAAIALGKLKARKAVIPLTEMLKSKNLRDRRAAAWALRRIDTPESKSALVIAQKDPDDKVRYWAGK